MKPSEITATDQFCGAGGSSQGFKQAVQEMGLGNGARVRLAMNHWPLAIETHNTNFPDTDHACTDISACDPRRYPSTNILITSPECTGPRNAWKETFHYESEYEPDLGSLKWTVFDGPRKEGEVEIDTVKEYDTSPQGLIRSLWPGRRRYRTSAPILDASKLQLVNDRHQYWICYDGPTYAARIPQEIVDKLRLDRTFSHRLKIGSGLALEILIECCAHDECIPFEEI